MQIHELKVNKKKSRKRVGRGGKRGTYSGRGMKGQKSRSGGNVDPLFAGGQTSLIDKMKKVRGFKSIHPKKNVFNLNDIEKEFKDGDKVSARKIIEIGMVRASKAKNGIKILGDGEIKIKIEVADNILVSKSAKKAIENAGGKVMEVKVEKIENKEETKKE